MSTNAKAPDLLPIAPAHHGSAPRSLPLVEKLRSGLDPWKTFQRLAHLPHVLFLDSAARSGQLGRYSFLTADPFEWLRSRGRRVFLSSQPQPLEPADPFQVLAELLARCRTDARPARSSEREAPGFQGGAAGLFGYDLCHHIERLPRPPHDDFTIPDLAVGFYDWTIAFDHETGDAWLFSQGFPETDPLRREARAAARIGEVRDLLRARIRKGPRHERRWPALPPVTPHRQWPVPGIPGLTSNFDRDTYLATVRRAIEYIHAGDCFQVNIAQRLLWPATTSPLELYRRLRERNPAPFAGYFDLGDFVIASASPERFLRIDDGTIETRPIKGTRPRGVTPEEDFARIDDLQASAKDRAENVMIVDLLRNDLGRVCRYGSVQVESVCQIETYKYVHHLVSVLRGQLREGLGPVDALRAAFPGGSVTGAPKVRAMEIIAELEPTARGPYCGSLGYIGFDGSMDTNILIRTFTAGRGWVQFPVGGGIVADSVPEREYEETWHKAEGLLRALK